MRGPCDTLQLSAGLPQFQGHPVNITSSEAQNLLEAAFLCLCSECFPKWPEELICFCFSEHFHYSLFEITSSEQWMWLSSSLLLTPVQLFLLWSIHIHNLPSSALLIWQAVVLQLIPSFFCLCFNYPRDLVFWRLLLLASLISLGDNSVLHSSGLVSFTGPGREEWNERTRNYWALHVGKPDVS